MKATSHRCEFSVSDLAKNLGGPVLVLLCFSLAMHLGGPLWPRPRAALDLDRTILLHQADASQKRSDAQLLLVGDSSCLMNVSARRLQELIGIPVRNLATLSDVPLGMHARLIRNFSQANPGQPKIVVLLMHPRTLRLGERTDYFADIIDAHLSGRESYSAQASGPAWWTGAAIFKERFLSRALPVPLPGEFGRHYGFNWNLSDYMDEQLGSAIDPRRFEKMQGNPEVRLSSHWLKAGEVFRSLLPHGTKLVVGITPSPHGFALPSHAEACAEILNQWADCLKADARLWLPHTIPDEQFASETHLNAQGALYYSSLLADVLKTTGILSDQSPP